MPDDEKDEEISDMTMMRKPLAMMRRTLEGRMRSMSDSIWEDE